MDKKQVNTTILAIREKLHTSASELNDILYCNNPPELIWGQIDRIIIIFTRLERELKDISREFEEK